MQQKTIDFIKAHQDDDVRALALKAAGRTDIDMPFALDQIAGRQTARRKLPSWAAVEGIVYPPHLSMEQCSGEPAARYKAGVAARLAGGGEPSGRLVDITGGFGADFSFMARCFAEAVYVERQEHLCDVARCNLRLLGLPEAVVVCGDGIGYMARMEGRATVIFADPARRDGGGGRTFAIADCTPDVLGPMDLLLSKADWLMLKLSPMLDWRKAVGDIETAAGKAGVVREVHVVSVGNECKELLVVVSALDAVPARPMMYCVNAAMKRGMAGEAFPRLPDGGGNDASYDVLSFPLDADTGAGAAAGVCEDGLLAGAAVGCPVCDSPQSSLPSFLYEPNASVMKAGCFGLIERRYGMRQISRDSHLFVCDRPVADFPGRRFAIDTVTSMNRRGLRAALAGVSKANITVRNFPMTADALRRRLKLSDGGDTYIFATTDGGGRHLLLVCRKI